MNEFAEIESAPEVPLLSSWNDDACMCCGFQGRWPMGLLNRYFWKFLPMMLSFLFASWLFFALNGCVFVPVFAADVFSQTNPMSLKIFWSFWTLNSALLLLYIFAEAAWQLFAWLFGIELGHNWICNLAWRLVPLPVRATIFEENTYLASAATLKWPWPAQISL